MKRLTSKQEAEFTKIAKELGRKASTEARYMVSFDDYTTTMSESELLHFTKTAVIRNKDISSFTVTRVKCSWRSLGFIHPFINILGKP